MLNPAPGSNEFAENLMLSLGMVYTVSGLGVRVVASMLAACRKNLFTAYDIQREQQQTTQRYAMNRCFVVTFV